MDTFYGFDFNNPTTLNKYLYACANPVMYSDPSGHFIAGALITGLVTRVGSFFIGKMVSFIFEGMVSEALDGIIAADGSEIVNSANRTANLDSFEFLFRYNNALMRFNLVLSLGSLAMGASKVEIGGFQENYEMMFSGAKASISAAKSLADAFKMRYDNYDFIFEYASGDYDDVMEKYKEFTKSNITSTASTVVDMFTGALADAVGNEEYEFITKVWDTVSDSWTLLQSAAKRESLTDEDAEALWNLFDRFT